MVFSTETLDGSRVWAVIIGLDKYTFASDLNGACADAKAVYDYLTSDLQVPPDNILLLTYPFLDQDLTGDHTSFPTHDCILRALFGHLRDNSSVQANDYILVYYAGYGSRYLMSSDEEYGQGWEDNELGVNAICTYDGQDISDRELFLFVNELHQEKGDNIVVILDCCFTRGSNRTFVHDVRYVSPDPDESGLLSRALDDPRRRLGPHDINYDPSSGMYLLACTVRELAEEASFDDQWHGRFTHALLHSLKQKQYVNYQELRDAIRELMPPVAGLYELRTQNPAFYGSKLGSKPWFISSQIASHGFDSNSMANRPPDASGNGHVLKTKPVATVPVQEALHIPDFLYRRVPNHLLVYPNPPSNEDWINLDFDGSRVWAVLIGIDAYDTLRDLFGACADAGKVADYLKARYRVPDHQVRLLSTTLPAEASTYPTRANIFKTLNEYLYDNHDIQQDDTVLLYFSGYGSSYRIHGTQDDILALCPADRGSMSQGCSTPDITIRELSTFLSHFGRIKRVNIVVVLDCSFRDISHIPDAAAAGCIRAAPPLALDAEADIFPYDSQFYQRRSKEEYDKFNFALTRHTYADILFGLQRSLYARESLDISSTSTDPSVSYAPGIPNSSSVTYVHALDYAIKTVKRLRQDSTRSSESMPREKLEPTIVFACQPHEDAREYKSRPQGFLTKALLQRHQLGGVLRCRDCCEEIVRCIPCFGGHPVQTPYMVSEGKGLLLMIDQFERLS